MKSKIELPLGIKAISAYYILISVIYLITGLISLMFPKKIMEYLISEVVELSLIEPVSFSKILLIMSITFIVLGIFGLFLSFSLSKLKSWARGVIIFVSLFGFFMSITGLVSGQWTNIFGLIINGIIAWYLIFNKNVKKIYKGI